MRKPATSAAQGRKIELAKIHMAAGELGLITRTDDTAYRDMLWSVGRVRSAKDLDAGGRERVLEHLRRCGWRDSKPFVHGRKPASPQAAKIRAIWTRLHEAGHVQDGSDRALRAYVRRMSAPVHPQRVGYSAPDLLPPCAAQHVIECLKRWAQRLGVDIAP